MTLHRFTAVRMVWRYTNWGRTTHRYAVFVECYNASFGAWPVPYADRRKYAGLPRTEAVRRDRLTPTARLSY